MTNSLCTNVQSSNSAIKNILFANYNFTKYPLKKILIIEVWDEQLYYSYNNPYFNLIDIVDDDTLYKSKQISKMENIANKMPKKYQKIQRDFTWIFFSKINMVFEWRRTYQQISDIINT